MDSLDKRRREHEIFYRLHDGGPSERQRLARCREWETPAVSLLAELRRDAVWPASQKAFVTLIILPCSRGALHRKVHHKYRE